MTKEKCMQVLAMYKRLLIEKDIPPEGAIHEIPCPTLKENVFMHLHSMIYEMEGFLEEGRTEKFMRWLGFIQGCFWTSGKFTLEELMNHNRPTENLFPSE